MRSRYSGFVKDCGGGLPDEADALIAYRRPEGRSGPPAEWGSGGQYQLRQRRERGGISLAGVNFEAWLAPHGAAGPGWLAVAGEHELAQPNVIENLMRVLAAHRALGLGGLVLHSAGLVVGGRAWLFAGRSGAGKTTLTRKARDGGLRVLSDDINLLLPAGGGYRAYAVPFTGDLGRILPAEEARLAYPLAALVLLEQGAGLDVAPVSGASAVARLLANCPFVNMDDHESDLLYDVLSALVRRVPVFRLRCRRDDDLDRILDHVAARIGCDDGR